MSSSGKVVEGIGTRLRAFGRMVIVIGVAISGQASCESGIEPSSGYAGTWSGATSQGRPVQFMVSSADQVTSISIAYDFSPSCTGSLTFTDLALTIHTLNPPGPPPYDQPGFGHATTSVDGTNGTIIGGHFSSDRRSASGQFSLVNFPGCGTVAASWSAARG